MGRGEYPRLDRDPLVSAISDWRLAGGTMQSLSFESGVPDRTIRRYMSGESRHVRIDVADRLCMVLPTAFNTMYPYD